MNQTGAQFFSRQRAGVREQGVDQRAGRRSVRGMRDHPGGFVDDDQVVVLVDDRDVDRFGFCPQARARNDLVFERIAGFEQATSLGHFAVDRHAAAMNRIGDQRSRGAAQARDGYVGPLAGLVRRDDV